MISLANISPKEALEEPGMSLRELCVYYDSKVLDTWDHTSSVLAMLHSIGCTILAMGGSKVKPKPPSAFHPYRTEKEQKMKITKANIKDLKFIARK